MAEHFRSPIGIIAGSGEFPLAVARKARDQQLEVVAIAHVGETDAAIESLALKTVWVRVGQLGKIIKSLKDSNVKEVTFAGGIRRVNLLRGVRLDLKALALISRLRSVRDDALLRGVAEELEGFGMRVFSAGDLLTESSPGEGILTRRGLSESELRDALIGWETAKTLGSLDVGQMVVSYEGVVIAVETIEGTDETILRAGSLAKTDSTPAARFAGPVVVKVSKPQQDLRLDVPAVGPDTIETMKKAGMTALVIEAQKCVLLDPQKVVETANAAGIAIEVIPSQDILERRQPQS